MFLPTHAHARRTRVTATLSLHAGACRWCGDPPRSGPHQSAQTMIRQCTVSDVPMLRRQGGPRQVVTTGEVRVPIGRSSNRPQSVVLGAFDQRTVSTAVRKAPIHGQSASASAPGS